MHVLVIQSILHSPVTKGSRLVPSLRGPNCVHRSCPTCQLAQLPLPSAGATPAVVPQLACLQAAWAHAAVLLSPHCLAQEDGDMRADGCRS